jgi:perosamine synthetase
MISLHTPMLGETDEAYVLETIRSGWVSTAGAFVERFETEFARFVGASYAASVCNGTVAIQLVLETLKRQNAVTEPFEVLVPTLTFIATGAAVVHAGGTPVFMDCAANSMNVDAKTILATIAENYHFDSSSNSRKSKESGRVLLAVLTAHIMGWGEPTAELRASLDELKIPLVEDAAESVGCLDRTRRHFGTFGIAGVFSFNGNKILTTGGGGMIVTNNEEFGKRLKHLSTTAKTDKLRYVHDEIGYNYRMVNTLSALGCSQLNALPDRLIQKAKIFEYYREYLDGQSNIKVYSEDTGVRSNYWLVNAIFSNEALREKVLRGLIELQIEARPLWMPLHLQPAFKQICHNSDSFPNAENIWSRALSLPSGPQLTKEIVKKICTIILDINHELR